ncbi:MAG: TdeIII family type II restriction endonuclease [Gammaproteobacteria bacterium]
MALTRQQFDSVKNTIMASIRKKLAKHSPEPAVMPFHTRLLGKDRLALYSFIHSLNTNFGTTIFEPVAVALAKDRFTAAKSQVTPGQKISMAAQREIQNIMDALTAGGARPDKPAEIEAIRKVCQEGGMQTVKTTKVDVYLEKNNEVYLVDLKTAKPNMAQFNSIKRILLEWTAVFLSEKPGAKINTLIAIPYNPYAPKPYSRWTMAGMLDAEHELKVAEGFWDFLGGQGAYDGLLNCFEQAGLEMQSEIDAYFSKFRAN